MAKVKKTYKFLTARQVLITTDRAISTMQYSTNGGIAKIMVDEEDIVKIGDVVGVKFYSKQTPFKVRFIEPCGSKDIVISCSRRNKSSYILPPMLLPDKNKLYWDSYFINAYLSIDGIIAEERIHLLYRFSDTKEYKELEKYMTNHKYYIKTIDVNGFYVLYVFIIPDGYMADFVLFTNSKYSKMSKKFRDKVLKFHNATAGGTLYGVLYKTKEAVQTLEKKLDVALPEDSELWSRLNKSEEESLIINTL